MRRTGAYVEAPKVEVFLAEIVECCRRHGFNIEHADSHCAFVIEAMAADEMPAVMHAHLGRTVPLEQG